MDRLDLAQGSGDTELIGVAERRVSAASEGVRALNERLDALRRQRPIRERVAAAAPKARGSAAAADGDHEARFRRLSANAI